MVRTAIRFSMTIGASVLIYWAWDNITELRGTIAWEYRWIVFGCAVFLLLGLLEKGLSKLGK